MAYQQDWLGVAGNVPTIGLSSFVSALTAFVALVYPSMKMSVFIWVFIMLIRINIPALIFVAYFVISDWYGIAYLWNEDTINYMAHLAGAAVGTNFGLIYVSYN